MNHFLKPFILTISILVAADGCLPALSWAQGFQPLSGLPAGLESAATFHAGENSFLYLGSGGSLFISADRGKNWKQAASLGPNVRLNDLYLNGSEIFLLTSDGVWKNEQNQLTWKPVFQPINREERNAFTLARDPNRLEVFYLGTKNGLFKSEDSGKSWTKISFGEQHSVLKIQTDFENEEIFIAGEDGVHRSIPGRNQLETVYQALAFTPEIEEAAESDETGEADLEKSLTTVKTICVTRNSETKIFIGTSRGVFMSDDEGNRWERLPGAGLLNSNVTALAYSDALNLLFAGTEKGAFVYDFKAPRWRELYEGLPAASIRQLALSADKEEILYVLTANGVYFANTTEFISPWEVRIPAMNHWALLQTLFRAEPSAGAIQKEAMRYANVGNWKIRRWQFLSRMKALIPSLSIGKNFSTANNIDLDRGGTSDPDKFIFGPADTDSSWNYDLDWNLPDLLFNSAQTSIDSREKLMIELRSDILNEITRLYFERRRAQVEYVLRKPADPVEQINALLRIDELTADIDALTNGYLTKQLEKIYDTQTEFYDLWETSAKSGASVAINGKTE